MNFSSVFTDTHCDVIVQYMLAEFLIGSVAGIAISQVMRFRAKQSDSHQVVSIREYESPHFGTNFPSSFFTVLPLPLTFVIVERDQSGIIKEYFFDLLGSSINTKYENREYLGTRDRLWNFPLYFCMILIPCVMGLFIGLPIVGDFLKPLFYSGVGWFTITLCVIKPIIDQVD